MCHLKLGDTFLCLYRSIKMNMKIPGILTDVTTKGVVVETSQIKDIPQNKT